MNTQRLLTTAMNPGPFLTLILLSHTAKSADEGWRVVSSDPTKLPGTTLSETEDTTGLESDQPAFMNLEPVISRTRCPHRRSAWWRGLTLLTMLSRHTPRRPRPCWQGLTLPRGCVMVTRYASQ